MFIFNLLLDSGMRRNDGTMIRDDDRVEALAVRDGIIVATGVKKNVLSLQGPTTRMLDLQGRALLPGFIDAHSHVVQSTLRFSRPSRKAKQYILQIPVDPRMAVKGFTSRPLPSTTTKVDVWPAS
jgi:cytosine/adenosine deaminase-related metal-dependent hydrolase